MKIKQIQIWFRRLKGWDRCVQRPWCSDGGALREEGLRGGDGLSHGGGSAEHVPEDRLHRRSASDAPQGRRG